MMPWEYGATRETRTGLDVYVLREGDKLRAEIAPQFGNHCFALRGRVPILEEVGWEEYRKQPTSFGMPILFPYPNRIRDGVFVFAGKRYAVSPNRHGYVRDKPWHVVEHGADAGGAFLTAMFRSADYPEEILAQYPFPFRLDVSYRLCGGEFRLTARARNEGDAPMPCGFGIHPYFRRPDQARLCLPARSRYELEDALPTGRLLAVSGPYDFRTAAEIGGTVLDDVYTDLLPEEDGKVRCRLSGAEGETIVEFDAGSFPVVVPFTPPVPRQAVCIEPYTCPTDAFNLQERGLCKDVIVLGPGEERTWEIGIRHAAPG